MAFSAKIKLVALAVIYVLHVTFFDALMANGVHDLHACSISFDSHQSSSKSNSTGESSYRLLTKHEQAKQIGVNIPDALDFVSVAFTCFIDEQNNKPQFGAFAQLNAATFKLYRLYRVFLI